MNKYIFVFLLNTRLGSLLLYSTIKICLSVYQCMFWFNADIIEWSYSGMLLITKFGVSSSISYLQNSGSSTISVPLQAVTVSGVILPWNLIPDIKRCWLEKTFFWMTLFLCSTLNTWSTICLCKCASCTMLGGDVITKDRVGIQKSLDKLEREPGNWKHWWNTMLRCENLGLQLGGENLWPDSIISDHTVDINPLWAGIVNRTCCFGIQEKAFLGVW